MNYRKIWENSHGEIPKDERGVTFDIHHLDGNRKNNDITNLVCLSVKDHYKIHFQQYEKTKSHKDFAALVFLSSRLNKSTETLTGHTVSDEVREKIRKTLTGKKRPSSVGEKVKLRLKDYKWSDQALENRRQGIIRYHENVSEERKKEIGNKISLGLLGHKKTKETILKLSKFNSKHSDETVLEIDKSIKDGVNYKTISIKYDISLSQITAIKQRKTYKWLWNLEAED